MLNYRTPGVYIEEISSLPASIAQVETAIPAFVGYTSRRSRKRERIPKNTPFLIHSFEEYEKCFGGPFNESFSVTLQTNVTAVNNTSITIKPEISGLSKYLMHHCMQFYFGNGGGRCYIVSVGECYDDNSGEKSIRLDDLKAGLKSLEKEDEPTVLVIPEAVNLGDEERKTLHEKILDQCGKLKDRFAILDVLEYGYTDSEADAGRFRDKETGVNNLAYGAAYYPSLQTTIRRFYDEKSVVITDARKRVGRGSVDGKTLAELTANENHKLLCRQIKKELNKMRVRLFPSAAIAGVYARVDRERGVWKAPANVSVNLTESPSKMLTNQDQRVLNVDADSGKSINAIRSFEERGTLVWGCQNSCRK
ncbi:hypothetical protein BH23BAC3_BH23BAC3_18910 [soil metagenome]